MLGVGPAPAGSGAGFVAADIPGLIEGAAEGAGLGHAFLRHVDRCRLLLHVVDIASTEYRDPVEDIKVINGELERYSAELAGRPQIIVANKVDALDRERVDIPAFEAYVASLGCPLVYVSAVTGEGIDKMIALTVSELSKLPPIKVYEREYEPEDAYVGGGRETNRSTSFRRSCAAAVCSTSLRRTAAPTAAPFRYTALNSNMLNKIKSEVYREHLA